MKTHEFDSSLTCNYCGVAAERVDYPGGADKAPCPKRVNEGKPRTYPKSPRSSLHGDTVAAIAVALEYRIQLNRRCRDLWGGRLHSAGYLLDEICDCFLFEVPAADREEILEIFLTKD